jgi:heat shock transcription factor
MYGLRKTSRITDGSLRQFGKDPKGTKSPNTYSHPYFRRDQTNLLCLIQKPEGRSSSKRTYDGIVKAIDSEDDEKQFTPSAFEGRPPCELDIAVARSDPVSLPHDVNSGERYELEKLHNHQQCIPEAITQLKQQSDATIRQAAASQAIHDKHKSSIDAILTFLANYYDCSTESQVIGILLTYLAPWQNGAMCRLIMWLKPPLELCQTVFPPRGGQSSYLLSKQHPFHDPEKRQECLK